MKNIRQEKQDGICVIRVTRQEKLNTLNIETIEELTQAFTALRSDPEVRALVITGEGEKAFIAGADIKELNQLNPTTAWEFSRKGQELMSLIENLGKPTIAAINGFCLGGGSELALACTLRIASEDAKLGQPEVKLGIITGFGGSHRLVRLLGKARAMEVCLLGDNITAQRALEIGLVNKVAKKESLMDEVMSLAKSIANMAPVAIKYTMEAVNNPCDETERQLFALCFGTEDMKEGTGAFLEKRKPLFKGK